MEPESRQRRPLLKPTHHKASHSQFNPGSLVYLHANDLGHMITAITNMHILHQW